MPNRYRVYWTPERVSKIAQHGSATLLASEPGLGAERAEQRQQMVREFFVPRLKPTDKVLDLGCGAFVSGLPLIRHLDAGNYYGLDLHPQFVLAGLEALPEDARAKLDQNNVRVGGGFPLDKFGVKFDAIIAISLFPHLSDSEACRCFKAVADALTPGGSFYFTFSLGERKQSTRVFKYWSMRSLKLCAPQFHIEDLGPLSDDGPVGKQNVARANGNQHLLTGRRLSPGSTPGAGVRCISPRRPSQVISVQQSMPNRF